MVIVFPTVRRFIIRIKTAHFTLGVKNCFYTHTHTRMLAAEQVHVAKKSQTFTPYKKKKKKKQKKTLPIQALCSSPPRAGRETRSQAQAKPLRTLRSFRVLCLPFGSVLDSTAHPSTLSPFLHGPYLTEGPSSRTLIFLRSF